MNLAYYFYGELGNNSMARLPVYRQDFFEDLGNQPEKSERCQPHERVSGELSYGLGFVFPILQAATWVDPPKLQWMYPIVRLR
ncbi:MAG: hypothetical protein ACK6AD_06935 [Cyanobacteriota bacterium]